MDKNKFASTGLKEILILYCINHSYVQYLSSPVRTEVRKGAITVKYTKLCAKRMSSQQMY